MAGGSQPTMMAEMPRRPCEAMAIRSQPFASAVSMTPGRGLTLDADHLADHACCWRCVGNGAKSLLARIDELAGKKHGRVAVEQVAESVRNGRPTLYRPELVELAHRLGLLGLIGVEMADAFNVDVGTLIEWKARHWEFREAIKRGDVHADARAPAEPDDAGGKAEG